MGNDFYEDVLVKLHRKYGKDELVLALKKQISEKDIEIGILKSEKDELIYQHQREKNEICQKYEKGIQEQERFKKLQIQIKELKRQNDLIREEKRQLILKINK